MVLEKGIPRDHCGVFGVYGSNNAARLTYYALYALQHRGQESAGIAVSNGDRVAIHRGMGLVSEVFNDSLLEALEGSMGVGHVRYSTFGASELLNAQPIMVRFRKGSLVIAHNGNIVNASVLREQLELEGSIFQTGVDTEVLAHLIARQNSDFVSSVVKSLGRVRGGYAVILMTERLLMAARDPNGIRPLCIGSIDGGVVFASESCAFDTVGAEFIRDVRPGELVMVKDGTIESVQALPSVSEKLCAFEYIYFARPDSNLRGANVHSVRKQLGRILARNHPADADIVIGVPDSSLSAASGYAEEVRIPYEMGLVKNRYIGRTFIQPIPELRELGVKLKLNPLSKVISGKRVVLVDDSIVRGTTSEHIVRLLREAGAVEVHVRISAPPYKYPCYYGIDTSATGELLASSMEVDEIRKLIGADSLFYLSIDELVEAIGVSQDELCLACFNGEYPVDVKGGSRYYVM